MPDFLPSEAVRADMLGEDGPQRGRHRFGWIVDQSMSRPTEICDRPVANSEHFIVLPSLGALVPGWVLVVPRRPILNLGALNEIERADLDALVHYLRNVLSSVTNDVFEFEHGPQDRDSSVGCGVDQAHLHLVPLPFDLLSAALEVDNRTIQWRDIPNNSVERYFEESRSLEPDPRRPGLSCGAKRAWKVDTGDTISAFVAVVSTTHRFPIRETRAVGLPATPGQ